MEPLNQGPEISDRPLIAPSIQLSPAAQYLRMSTENQRYSIPNQSAAIALYAAAHSTGIIRSFVDEGKSGTTIKWRKGLQELLRVVASGADFKQVLVYDVSRWGRFPDSDEAAHYEFLCKQAGIAGQAITAGYGELKWAVGDPDLTCLHDDPEFERLLSGGGQRISSLCITGYPETEHSGAV
jgi:hypothetical protein